jgi:hypothetical protein
MGSLVNISVAGKVARRHRRAVAVTRRGKGSGMAAKLDVENPPFVALGSKPISIEYLKSVRNLSHSRRAARLANLSPQVKYWR